MKRRFCLSLVFLSLFCFCETDVVSGQGEDFPWEMFIPAFTAKRIRINSLSTTSAQPFFILTIDGSGFDPEADFFVRFTDAQGFYVDVPALEATSNSIKVSVPPLFDPGTGDLANGLVRLNVIQKSGSGTFRSNIISGFEILVLPSHQWSAGTITLSYLEGAIELAYQLQNDVQGTRFDTTEFHSALNTQISNLETLAGQVQAIKESPSLTFNLGSIGGTPIIIKASDLQDVDRMILGVLDSQAGGNPSVQGPPRAFPPFRVASVQSSLIGLGLFNVASLQSSEQCGKQEAANYIDDLLHNPGQTTSRWSYMGASRTCAPEAFKTSYNIVGGAGAVGIGILALLGAPAISLALPSAALLYITIVGAGGEMGLGAALGNLGIPGAVDHIKNGVERIENQMKSILTGMVLPNSVGTVVGLLDGASSFMSEFIEGCDREDPPPSYTLSTGVAGTGSGSVSASPPCCTYSSGTVVTLTATAQTGSTFSGWSGACSGTGSCFVTMDGNKTVTATFEIESPPVPSISGSWSGSWWVISPSPCSGISGSWSATLTVTNGIISGQYSGAWYSGPVSGTWDGTTATWSVGGGGGITFQGTVSGNSVSGSWWGGDDCYDENWNNLGPTSGSFSGSRN